MAVYFVIANYLKLFFANPRPYMLNPEIIPHYCSDTFGSPSGHSTIAAVFVIVLFFDIFHGKSKSAPRVFSNWLYWPALVFTVYWSIAIPYTRMVLGVHSLDQVLFGLSLGVISGFVLHFVVRDNLIGHIDDVIRHHEPSTSQETLLGQPETSTNFKPRTFLIRVCLFLLLFFTLCLITFN